MLQDDEVHRAQFAGRCEAHGLVWRNVGQYSLAFARNVQQEADTRTTRRGVTPVDAGRRNADRPAPASVRRTTHDRRRGRDGNEASAPHRHATRLVRGPFDLEMPPTWL